MTSWYLGLSQSARARLGLHLTVSRMRTGIQFENILSRGLLELAAAGRVPAMGRKAPERFFLHVLSGEAPIDHVQRTMLASPIAPHPLLKRIMQIHITEEARHICFASRYLTETFPTLGIYRKTALRVVAPFVVGATMMQMMRLPADVVHQHGVPRDVVREVHKSSGYREQVVRSVRPIHQLCVKLGIVTPRTAPLWNVMGLASRAAAD